MQMAFSVTSKIDLLLLKRVPYYSIIISEARAWMLIIIYIGTSGWRGNETGFFKQDTICV